MTYCEFVRTTDIHPAHVHYHDSDYGAPTMDEAQLFERLILEVNQAGLSWDMVLKRRQTIWSAYSECDVDTVAQYGEEDIARLLADTGVIRNRLKVLAAITNAQKMIEMRETHGGFGQWLEVHHPLSREDWTKLFKKTFKFTGGEIVNEFLMSLGYLPGAHTPDCPFYEIVLSKKPAWARRV